MARAIRVIALLSLLGSIYAVVLTTGCTPSDQLGGVELINAVPDTYITGTPPYLRATDFFVEFYWSGTDPDGRVAGYQWKMSTNGDDGISVYDTLTVDPASGDTINPWTYTTATDSVFFVTADSSSFLDDADLPEELRRFHQPHTFFVRAVDDEGQVDPTPAMITFTATTFAPTVSVTAPPSIADTRLVESKTVPPTFTVKWNGTDPDLDLGTPTAVRYLLKDALYTNQYGDEGYITNKYQYETVSDTIITFEDTGWSDWIAYATDAEDRQQIFSRSKLDAFGRRKHYLFAMQARDTAGAVSLDRGYGSAVKNFYINDVASPTLTVRETYLGTLQGTGRYGRTVVDIAQNQPLQFSWSATAASYGAEIAGYRYGWDVGDLTDDDDDGWVNQYGLTDSHLEADLITFDQSSHTLTIEVIDNAGLLTRYSYVVNVVPVPDPMDQLPVILIDDVFDHVSGAWEEEDGYPAWYQDVYRDAFWEEVLGGSGGVLGFNAERDMLDNEDNVGSWGYRDVVSYRNLIWHSIFSTETYINNNFKGAKITQPDGERLPVEQYVWLETYQQSVGNVFLAGRGVVSAFHVTDYDDVKWLWPIIYTSDEEHTTNCSAGTRALGFSTREEDDGSITVVGTKQYGYRGLGITVLSHTVPQDFYVSNSRCGKASLDFKKRCTGTKGIILDPDFKDEYIGGEAFADTAYIWETIDWEDHEDPIPDVNDAYSFGNINEYYNANVTPRATPWLEQTDESGNPVIVPMWHNYTRYDYILDQHLLAGDTDYPDFDPADICGDEAINEFTGRTKTDGVPVGVFTFQAAPYKPDGTADVIWGFDPHAMDHEVMKDAIRWVLGDYFELDMTPSTD